MWGVYKIFFCSDARKPLILLVFSKSSVSPLVSEFCLKAIVFRFFCCLFTKSFLRTLPFPAQIRIPADKPPFATSRMATDKGGFMELRIWFRCFFSVVDVHWQRWVKKGGWAAKKDAVSWKHSDMFIRLYVLLHHLATLSCSLTFLMPLKCSPKESGALLLFHLCPFFNWYRPRPVLIRIFSSQSFFRTRCNCRRLQ